jgi:HD-GYP domain-containing protein (c-di-GMP phosphodiesterase class II)
MLDSLDFGWPLAETVVQHHERLDGSGYPRGLVGESISFEARVMAVADVVEAMSTHRPYRPALGIDAAVDEIRQQRGILYDTAVVDACLAVVTNGFEFEHD